MYSNLIYTPSKKCQEGVVCPPVREKYLKLLAHSFLSLTINSLFASGSRLCYSLCYCVFVRSFSLYSLIVMSSPSKQPPTAAASPSDVESTEITPMKLLAAPTTVLASFVQLLDFPGADAESEIKQMFSEWGITKWVDLACVAAKDVETFIDMSESTALRPQHLWKQLGFLVEYARLGRDVKPTTSIWSVICAVDVYHANPHKSDPRPPMSPPCASLHQEKKTVPDLKEFTGKDEDYFSWRDSAVNDLGKAGLIHFTNDPSMVTKRPEINHQLLPLKAKRGVIILPDAVTVKAHVARFVSHVDFLI